MRAIPPGLKGATLRAGEENPDLANWQRTPFQIGKDADEQPVAVTRWTFSPAERQAIAAGADVWMLQYLDDRPMPSQDLIVGLATDGVAIIGPPTAREG